MRGGAHEKKLGSRSWNPSKRSCSLTNGRNVGLREDGLLDVVWCEVPSGTFLMGSDPDKDPQALKYEQPQHEVHLPTYQISRYPITNAHYQAFVDDGGKEPRKYPEPFSLSNHPVIGVSWDDAAAFCEWLTVQLRNKGELQAGEVVRLPSEAEWEYAARGPEGYIYPWGNEPQPDPERANYEDTNLGATSAVGCFPRGASLFSGCEEMAGNVWEWCLDVWHDDYEGAPADGSARTIGGSYRVLRGGSWGDGPRFVRSADRGGSGRVLRGGSWLILPRVVRSANRIGDPPSDGDFLIGFRLVRIDL